MSSSVNFWSLMLAWYLNCGGRLAPDGLGVAVGGAGAGVGEVGGAGVGVGNTGGGGVASGSFEALVCCFSSAVRTLWRL